jgi:hypothetical protein
VTIDNQRTGHDNLFVLDRSQVNNLYFTPVSKDLKGYHAGLDKTARQVVSQGHLLFSMDVACANEDTGSRAFACPSGYQGIRRNDGNSVLLLPE